MTLKEAVGKVLEGWTLPNAVRKILEEAYFDAPQRTAAEGEDTRRAWVGLTDDEIEMIVENRRAAHWEFVRQVESILKEKNK